MTYVGALAISARLFSIRNGKHSHRRCRQHRNAAKARVGKHFIAHIWVLAEPPIFIPGGVLTWRGFYYYTLFSYIWNPRRVTLPCPRAPTEQG